jgi:ATP-dependent RNA helicase RhlE
MRFEELDLSDNMSSTRSTTCASRSARQCRRSVYPEILNGRDVLGVAQTGTGKTAAYLLPILSKLDDGGYPNNAVNCVVMSPTRELAQQIDQAMQGFAYYTPRCISVAVYGGNDGNRYDQELKSMRLVRRDHRHTGTTHLSHQSGQHRLSKGELLRTRRGRPYARHGIL